MTEAVAAVQSTPEATTPPTEGAKRSQGDIRADLAAKLEKRNREAQAQATEKRPARGEPPAKGPDGKFLPKDEQKAAPTKPEPKDAKATPEADDAAEEGDSEENLTKEQRELRAQRRKLSKRVQKVEAEFARRQSELESRAQQLQVHERTAQEEISAFKSDPIAWLKRRGIEPRQVFLDLAKEDAQDPTEKRFKELEERAKRAEEAAKEAANQTKEQQEQTKAIAAVHAKVLELYPAVSGDYPALSQHASKEEVAQEATKLFFEYRKQTGVELTSGAVFAMLEAKLKQYLREHQATGKQPEPPDRVRTVAKSEAVNPETTQQRRSADVSPRARSATSFNSETYAGQRGEQALSKRQQAREKMMSMVRERTR